MVTTGPRGVRPGMGFLRYLVPLFLAACATTQPEPTVIYNHDVQDLVSPTEGLGSEPIAAETMLTLIVENVAPATWDEPEVTIEIGEGFLLVTHRAEVQRAIRDFLTDLRRARLEDLGR